MSYLIPTIKRYFNDGSLKELFVFKNNLLNGYHIKWYDTGVINKIAYYVDSFKDNYYFEYYGEGCPKRIINYKFGLRHGESREFYNSNELTIKKPVPITIKSLKNRGWDIKFCAKTEKKIKNKQIFGR